MLGIATGSSVLANAQEYFLGVNLITMPMLLVSTQTLGQSVFSSTDPPILARFDGTHTLLVTLAYCLIFAAVAIVLTLRRDVKE